MRVALPSGEAMNMVPELLERGKRVIDLGGDFRFKDASLYEKFYKHEHKAKNILHQAVFRCQHFNITWLSSREELPYFLVVKFCRKTTFREYHQTVPHRCANRLFLLQTASKLRPWHFAPWSIVWAVNSDECWVDKKSMILQINLIIKISRYGPKVETLVTHGAPTVL